MNQTKSKSQVDPIELNDPDILTIFQIIKNTVFKLKDKTAIILWSSFILLILWGAEGDLKIFNNFLGDKWQNIESANGVRGRFYFVKELSNVSIFSPTFTTRRSIRPVATVPRPDIENTSSKGNKKGLSVSRSGRGMYESTASINS